MQPVTELVKQRADIVEAQEGRRALREVIVVQHDRQRAAVAARLRTQDAHPRTTALGLPREVVGDEHADHFSFGVHHFPQTSVGVIERNAVTFVETHAEEPRGAIEHRGLHGIEREIRLDLRIVDGKAFLAYLLRQIAPVPCSNRRRLAEFGGQRI